MVGSWFGENTGLNLCLEFRFAVQRKERAKRFGVKIENLAEPWFVVWVQSSEKGLGQTLVRQVRSSEKVMGRTLVGHVQNLEKECRRTLTGVLVLEKEIGRTLVCQFQNSEKGIGQTLVQQVRRSEKRPRLGLRLALGC